MISIKEAIEVVNKLKKAYELLVCVENIFDELNLDDYQSRVEEILGDFSEEYAGILE